MKSIIIGAGKVGYTIASTLAAKDYDVIVIDKEKERLEQVEEYLDVQVVEGSGAQVSVLEQAGIEDADLLIAVTEVDEMNMVACFIAKSYGVTTTIARVRKPEYAELDNTNRQTQLGIDLIINPEKVAAKAVAELILYPEAHDIEYYADGQVLLLGLKLGPNAKILGKTLIEINFPHPCVVVAIIRDDFIIIPSGKDVIMEKDEIFILAATKHMAEIEYYIGVKHKVINDIAIFGGDLLGYYLAKIFENKKRRFNVKLFEEDEELCEELSDSLSRTMIINGNGTDMNLMMDENISDMDIVVAVTDDDKENVLVAILSKHLGATKNIAQIRRSDYVNMLEKFGVDKAISPRSLAASSILRFINRGRILNLKMLQDDRAQMNEIIIPPNGRYSGMPLKDIKLPRNTIIGLIVRQGTIIVPHGEDQLLAGDRVVIFALTTVIKIAVDMLTSEQ